MGPGFEKGEMGGIPYYFSTEWRSQGIEHGFLGAAIDFSTPLLATSASRFCKAFGLRHLFLIKQVHGDGVIDIGALGRRFPSLPPFTVFENAADAVVAPPPLGRTADRIAIGVRTADCIPLLLRSEDGIAAIHVGWRGLANGLVPKAVGRFTSTQRISSISALIGPCAGPESYLVGPEVIEAIGPIARCEPRPDGKALLSLPGTVAAILTDLGVPAESIFDIGISTIQSNEFASYRRQGERAGRNLSFLVF